MVPSSFPHHNKHFFVINHGTLNAEMIKEMQNFNKLSKIPYFRDFLERNEHKFVVKSHIKESEKEYIKLFLCSELKKITINIMEIL